MDSPWLLVGLLAGATCSSVRRGALLGLVATVVALTGFYVLTGAVLDLDGESFARSALLWASANRVYFAGGLISGLLCGAAGAWWRARRTMASRSTTRVVVGVTGLLLLGEPLVLLMLGLLYPDGRVEIEHGPALVRQLLSLPGSWALTGRSPVTQAVYATEAIIGALLLMVMTVVGRQNRQATAPKRPSLDPAILP